MPIARHAARTLPSSLARAKVRRRKRNSASSCVKAALLTLVEISEGCAAFFYLGVIPPSVGRSRGYNMLRAAERYGQRLGGPVQGGGHGHGLAGSVVTRERELRGRR